MAWQEFNKREVKPDKVRTEIYIAIGVAAFVGFIIGLFVGGAQ